MGYMSAPAVGHNVIFLQDEAHPLLLCHHHEKNMPEGLINLFQKREIPGPDLNGTRGLESNPAES